MKFKNEKLVCMDFKKKKPTSAPIVRFIKQKPRVPILSIITETGREIIATSNHPFYTEDGMRDASRLEKQGRIAVYPFEGVDYEEPGDEVIVDEKAIRETLAVLGKSEGGNAFNQILNYLKKNELLPLRYNSSQLPYILKIMGYCFGDGTLFFAGICDIFRKI
jgi:tRNA-splicing ligase RtcB